MERARSALSVFDAHDRVLWVKYGMCIKAEFGDAGFDLWDDWASTADNHNAYAARTVWRGIKQDGKLSYNTLIYDAKAKGWKDDHVWRKPTKAELAARAAASAARKQAADEEEARRYAAIAAHALELWEAAKPVNDHPYLQRKGVLSYGLRAGRFSQLDLDTGEISTRCENGLLIPIRDRQRALWSLQCIPANEQASKLYLKGGKKQGNFFGLGGRPLEIDGRPVFAIGEGYATCATAHSSTGHLVLCAFDVANLANVARQLRAAKPDAIILLLADNDADDPANPGVTTCMRVARELSCCVAIPPPGDINDLQEAEGREAVAAVIDAALEAGPVQPEPPQPAQPEPPQPAQPRAPGPAAPPVEPAPAAAAPPADPDTSLEQPEDPTPELTNNGYFSILGYDGCTYYAFSYGKVQVLELTRSNFTPHGLVELAPMNWWEDRFAGQKGVSTVGAFEWFSGAAHRRGIFDERCIRGRGAWMDDGRVIYHRGGSLLVDGKETAIPALHSAYIYPRAKNIAWSPSAPMTDAEGAEMLATAQMMRWRRPVSAQLLAGWTFLAPIGGALQWRPHIWICGAAGSGKSYIQKHYVCSALRGIGEMFAGDTTEPGLRRTLMSDALPAIIDEFEPNDLRDKARIDSILTTMRQSSCETDASTAKGGADGTAARFHIRSAFCLASIATVLQKDSDISRVAVLEMLPPEKMTAASKWQELEARLLAMSADKRLPARLLSRGLQLMPTVLATIEVFVRIAARQFGTQRDGDQYGTLMAGAWCLTHSAVPTQAEAEAEWARHDWGELKSNTATQPDSERCLGAIMEAKIRFGGTDVTVHEAICEAAGAPVGNANMGPLTATDLLRRHGMRLEGDMLVFGVATVALRKLVADTPWATDLRGQLGRLEGASTMDNKVRKFAGVVSRVIGIPLSTVLD